MKKLKLILITLFLLLISINQYNCIVYADNDTNVSLEESIQTQLDTLDLSALEDIWNSSGVGDKGIREYISDIISGQEVFDIKAILSIAFDTGKASLIKLLPDICLIIGICILTSLVGDFINGDINDSINHLISSISNIAVMIIIFKDIAIVVNESATTINDITNAYNTIFPIILTVSTVTNPTSISSLSIITKTVSIVATNFNSSVIMPLFTACCVLTVVGGVNSNVKMGRLRKGIKSIATYIMGVTFFVLSLLLSLQGVMSNTLSNAFINTAKSSVSSSVPIVGGYISSGFDIVIMSASVIRNAIGVSGVFIISYMMTSTIIKVVIITIVLKLLAGITEVIGTNTLPKLFEESSSNVSLFTATLLGSVFVMSVNFISLTGC